MEILNQLYNSTPVHSSLRCLTTKITPVAPKKNDFSYSMNRCEECKKPNIRVNHIEGTVVCTDCGLVQQSRIIDDDMNM